MARAVLREKDSRLAHHIRGHLKSSSLPPAVATALLAVIRAAAALRSFRRRIHQEEVKEWCGVYSNTSITL